MTRQAMEKLLCALPCRSISLDADHFGFAFLKAAVQIQGPIGQVDAVGDWREVIHLGGEFQQVQDAAHLASHVIVHRW